MFPVPVIFDIFGNTTVWRFSEEDASFGIKWYNDNGARFGITEEKMAELADLVETRACEHPCTSVVRVMHMCAIHGAGAGRYLDQFMHVLWKQLSVHNLIKMAFEHSAQNKSHDKNETQVWGCPSSIYNPISSYRDWPGMSLNRLMELWEEAIDLKFVADYYRDAARASEDAEQVAEYERRQKACINSLYLVLNIHAPLFEAIEAAGGEY